MLNLTNTFELTKDSTSSSYAFTYQGGRYCLYVITAAAAATGRVDISFRRVADATPAQVAAQTDKGNVFVLFNTIFAIMKDYLDLSGREQMRMVRLHVPTGADGQKLKNIYANYIGQTLPSLRKCFDFEVEIGANYILCTNKNMN